MEAIFGELGTIPKFVIAFVLVLGLIAITAFLIRRFGNGRIATAGGGRGRQPRLAVLDSAVVDQKRRLVLIRRDNSEHLLLIGGPSDVVVETNIVRTGAPAPLAQPLTQAEPRRAAPPVTTPTPRGTAPQTVEPEIEAPIVPEPPHEEPVRAPAPRPQPAAYSPPPPLPPREPRPVAHPSANAQPQMPLPTPAAAPAPAPAPAAAAPQPQPETQGQPETQSPAQPKLDPQYADMAQRLEAALRRPATVPPAAASPQPPMPRNDTRPMMPQVNAPRPASTPPRPMQSAPEPVSKGPAAPAATPATSAPNPFDSLEAEMANLLGQEAKKRT